VRHISSIMFLTFTLLAGCTSSNIALESRNISVEQNAEPATTMTAEFEQALAKQVGPSYVTLTVSAVTAAGTGGEKSRTALTSGSGFVVDGSGYVMTAAHVAVKAGNSVSARAADGRIYSGKVVSILPSNDMALIKLRSFTGRAVSPVSRGCLAKGATVFTMGKPHSEGDTARFGSLESMSFGQPVKYGAFGYPDAMVMRMGTRKGESGGPVFDDQGKLAGMVVSTLSDGNGKSLNLAHAVPASRLADFLCKNSTCSSGWTALAPSSQSNCS
jgi:S1-C subfamily serine protease